MAEVMLFRVTRKQNTENPNHVLVEFTVSKAGYDIIKRPDEPFTSLGCLTMTNEVWLMLRDTLWRSPEYIETDEIEN